MNRAYENTYDTQGAITYITVTHKKKEWLRVVTIVDTDSVDTIKTTGLSIQGNYIFLALGIKYPLASLVMGHKPNTKDMVDHINGDTLDNRKQNLRILSKADNSSYRTQSHSNTGVVGVTLKPDKRTYLVSVTDRETKKIYTKQFNISKLGKEVAFKSAVSWRKAKCEEFNYVKGVL